RAVWGHDHECAVLDDECIADRHGRWLRAPGRAIRSEPVQQGHEHRLQGQVAPPGVECRREYESATAPALRLEDRDAAVVEAREHARGVRRLNAAIPVVARAGEVAVARI